MRKDDIARQRIGALLELLQRTNGSLDPQSLSRSYAIPLAEVRRVLANHGRL